MKALCSCGSFAPLQDGKCRLCYNDKPKKVAPPLRYKPRKATGEAQTFLEIWIERKHICEHCGIPLGYQMKPSFFSHRLAKSIRPDLRNDKTNIDLFCEACHDAYGARGKAAFDKRKNLYHSPASKARAQG